MPKVVNLTKRERYPSANPFVLLPNQRTALIANQKRQGQHLDRTPWGIGVDRYMPAFQAGVVGALPTSPSIVPAYTVDDRTWYLPNQRTVSTGHFAASKRIALIGIEAFRMQVSVVAPDKLR